MVYVLSYRFIRDGWDDGDSLAGPRSFLLEMIKAGPSLLETDETDFAHFENGTKLLLSHLSNVQLSSER